MTGWEKVKTSGGNIHRIPYEGERPMNLTWNSKYILRIRDEFMAKGDMTTLRDTSGVPVRLQAIRIGELGIAAIPCEVFAETGLAIKKQSPRVHCRKLL